MLLAFTTKVNEPPTLVGFFNQLKLGWRLAAGINSIRVSEHLRKLATK
jgi:hypothetical protein